MCNVIASLIFSLSVYHAGEAIIMMKYRYLSNVVADTIIKTRCSRIKRSMCIICNPI